MSPLHILVHILRHPNRPMPKTALELQAGVCHSTVKVFKREDLQRFRSPVELRIEGIYNSAAWADDIQPEGYGHVHFIHKVNTK